ncbi:paramyosin, short form-like [Prorops nasuta]|uniref:paramyosin, short form-like n=1 Tax=Prorops nasuta TaxID=863751 RepID=UPI0034CD9CCE
MSCYVPPSLMPLEEKWHHVPTHVYNQNYGYGMNYYQPMLDYVERRDGRSRPELPWNDGRLLWEDRPFRTYSRADLARRAIDAEDQARDHLSRFKIAKRSDFSREKTAQASHVTKEVFPYKSEDLRWRVPLSTRIELLRPRTRASRLSPEEMAEIELQSLRDVQAMNEVQDALEHGRNLRGKSARAIEFHLRAEAMKNLTKSQELADIRKFQRESVQSFYEDRNHSRLMLDRTRNLLDEDKLTEPLGHLNKELRGYEQKSSKYFLDKRYRDPGRQRMGCEFFRLRK